MDLALWIYSKMSIRKIKIFIMPLMAMLIEERIRSNAIWLRAIKLALGWPYINSWQGNTIREKRAMIYDRWPGAAREDPLY